MRHIVGSEGVQQAKGMSVSGRYEDRYHSMWERNRPPRASALVFIRRKLDKHNQTHRDLVVHVIMFEGLSTSTGRLCFESSFMFLKSRSTHCACLALCQVKEKECAMTHRRLSKPPDSLWNILTLYFTMSEPLSLAATASLISLGNIRANTNPRTGTRDMRFFSVHALL